MTLATSVSPRCIGIPVIWFWEDFWISPQVGKTWNLMSDVLACTLITLRIRCIPQAVENTRHGPSFLSLLVEDIWGKKWRCQRLIFVYFHHSLFLSNICRVRWFDQSLQNMSFRTKKTWWVAYSPCCVEIELHHCLWSADIWPFRVTCNKVFWTSLVTGIFRNAQHD